MNGDMVSKLQSLHGRSSDMSRSYNAYAAH